MNTHPGLLRQRRALIGAMLALAVGRGARVQAQTPRLAERVRKLLSAAQAQVGVTTGYDGSYRRISYPGGDVPAQTGVCTDVLIRAYRRAFDIDLQRLVHEDMRRAWPQYPKLWKLSRPDPNIDHRRVPNLETFLRRHGISMAPTLDSNRYLAGDIVTWRLPGGYPHIGIVSDRRPEGRPLVIHNIGAGVKIEDMLFAYPIAGHFRY